MDPVGKAFIDMDALPLPSAEATPVPATAAAAAAEEETEESSLDPAELTLESLDPSRRVRCSLLEPESEEEAEPLV